MFLPTLNKNVRTEKRTSIDKVMIALLMLLFSVPTYSQITVSGDRADGIPWGKSFLATKTPLGKEHPVLKILTHETSVQEHEGAEAYREVRDVEYTVKEKKGDFTIKRKVLKKEKTSVKDEETTKKFIDMTSDLQSSFLAPRTVKEKKLWGEIEPMEGVVTRKDEISYVFIDKLAPVKNELKDKKGRAVLLNFFGTVIEVTEYVETLGYSSQADKLYIDDLKTINTVFGSKHTKKNGEVLNMKNIENIEIVNIEY